MVVIRVLLVMMVALSVIRLRIIIIIGIFVLFSNRSKVRFRVFVRGKPWVTIDLGFVASPRV